MKRILIFALSLCITAAANAKDADTLKVMSYNLRFGELATMKEIGEYIASEAPDIVALQECDWATKRERARHQNGVKFVNELAWRTGMFGLYGKAINYKGGYYGIGLLSKYPIIKSERILLPNPENKEQRAMLIADIELPDGQVITFACTHLEVSSSDSRMQQVKFIRRKLAGRKPCLIAGDMNAVQSSPEMTWMRKTWTDLTDTEMTYSTVEPSIKIDYIYGKPSDSVKLISTGVQTSVKLSDHFPVISKIAIIK